MFLTLCLIGNKMARVINTTTTVEMGISSRFFNAIDDGSKSIEGHLHDEKRQVIMELLQDFRNPVIVRFTCTDSNQMIDRILRGYQIFSSFLEAAEKNYKKMVPWASSPKEAADVYREFFTAEQEAKYGVVLFTI